MRLLDKKITHIAACVLLGLTVSGCGSSEDPVEEITGTTIATDSGNGTVTGSVKLSSNNTFTPQTETATQYGKFSISESGAWSFEVTPTAAEYIAAAKNQVLTESITVKSTGGQEYQITVSTLGKDEAPTFGSGDGQDLGGFDYSGFDYSSPLEVTGFLPITDPDTEESAFTPEVATQGVFGVFSISSEGAWKYQLFSDQDGVRSTEQPASVMTRKENNTVETFTVTSVDGTTHAISITIENHGQFQQQLSYERIDIENTAGISDYDVLYKPTKLIEIVEAAIPTTLYKTKYNDEGDIEGTQSFNLLTGAVREARTYDYSERDGEFTRIYTTTTPSETGNKIRTETRTWDLDTGTFNQIDSKTDFYLADDSIDTAKSSYAYIREYSYNEQGKVEQIISTRSSSGNSSSPYVSNDYQYDDAGNRETTTAFWSSGNIRYVQKYEAGKLVSREDFDTDGVTLKSREETIYKDGKIYQVKKSGKYVDPKTKEVADSISLLNVTTSYYDKFGRLDKTSKVSYLAADVVDTAYGLYKTSYIYSQSLNLRVSYSLRFVTSENKYYFPVNPDTKNKVLYVERYQATKCGPSEKLSHAALSPDVKSEACPMTLPYPSTVEK